MVLEIRGDPGSDHPLSYKEFSVPDPTISHSNCSDSQFIAGDVNDSKLGYTIYPKLNGNYFRRLIIY